MLKVMHKIISVKQLKSN